MPSKKKIHNYWREKIDVTDCDNTCYKCGVTHPKYNAVERAHIKAYCLTKDNNVDNIHLLCSICHKNSEIFYGDAYWLWFNSDLDITSNRFFLKVGAHYYKNKITDLDEDLKNDFDNILNNMIKVHGEAVTWETINKLL